MFFIEIPSDTSRVEAYGRKESFPKAEQYGRDRSNPYRFAEL
jgi:hypothetical protein